MSRRRRREIEATIKELRERLHETGEINNPLIRGHLMEIEANWALINERTKTKKGNL